MNESYTSKEIAEALGVVRSSVIRRAVKEAWPAQTRRERGGGRLYALATLPTDVRVALSIAESRAIAARPQVPAALTPSLPQARVAQVAAVSAAKRERAIAKSDVTRLYVQTLQQAPWGTKQAAREQFMTSYHGGAWPELLRSVGPIESWKTLEKWKKALSRGQQDVLLDKRGLKQRGRTVLRREQQELLIGNALHPNRPSIASVIRKCRAVFQARGMNDIPSDRCMRRFLDAWAATNAQQWVFMREGEKAWNDKCAFFIERDYSLIEVGDILVADGHALNFEVVDWETGKPTRMELVLWYDMKSNYPLGWEVLPTENIQAIAAAFRRAVLRLGKYPTIAYLDNGKAFKSQYFTRTDFNQCGLGGVFHMLGVTPMFAWPYHGQSKTVERFFGSFAELERWVPSYTGTSIASKPPRMQRNEKLHKRLYTAAGGRPLTIEECHQALAWWFDEYVRRPQPSGHLEGRTPEEVFAAGRGPGVDVVELDHLMLATERRTIGRNGVRFRGENYYAPELYGRRHPVLLRYDLQDLEQVRVYEVDGGLICTARRVAKVHPAAELLGSDEDKARLEEAIRYKKQQFREASGTAREFLENVVLPETQERMARLAVVRNEATPKALPEEPQPTREHLARITAEHLARRAAEPAYQPPDHRRDIRTALDKYEYLFMTREREQIPLTPQDQAWMERYEETEEFQFATRGGERYRKLVALYARQRERAATS